MKAILNFGIFHWWFSYFFYLNI